MLIEKGNNYDSRNLFEAKEELYENIIPAKQKKLISIAILFSDN
jgi:hypothetical protein